MSQTTYNFNPAVATAGMLAEIREANLVISKVASGAVPVGQLCAPGADAEVGPSPTTADPNSANPGQVIAWPSGHTTDPVLGTDIVGVPIYDSSRPPFTTSNQYADKEPCPVLRKGVIWVQVFEAVIQFGDVYVWTGGSPPSTGLGTFAATAGAGKSKLSNGRFMTGVASASGGLVILEIW